MSVPDRPPRDPFRPEEAPAQPLHLARTVEPDVPGTLAGDIPLPPARRYPRLRRPGTYSIAMLVFAAIGIVTVGRWVARKAALHVPDTPELDLDTLFQAKVPIYSEVPAGEDAVLVSVTLTPRDARLFVDGQAAPSNPIRIRRGQHIVKLMAWAPGFSAESRDLVPDRDLNVELTLQRVQGDKRLGAKARP